MGTFNKFVFIKEFSQGSLKWNRYYRFNVVRVSLTWSNHTGYWVPAEGVRREIDWKPTRLVGTWSQHRVRCFQFWHIYYTCVGSNLGFSNISKDNLPGKKRPKNFLKNPWKLILVPTKAQVKGFETCLICLNSGQYRSSDDVQHIDSPVFNIKMKMLYFYAIWFEINRKGTFLPGRFIAQLYFIKVSKSMQKHDCIM